MTNPKKTTKQTEKQSKLPTIDLKDYTSKSAAIRDLHAKGLTRSDIVKIITAAQGKPIRYQHVRNVLITPVGKGKS